MSEIKVSVIVPVYNCEQYLEKCLNSLFNQTLDDVEIICVDDGSTDSSLELLKQYQLTHDNLIISQQKNKGAGEARNKGMDLARGEYISFVDADDWINNDALEKLHMHAVSNDIEVVLFNSIERNSDGTTRKRIYLSKNKNIDYDKYVFNYYSYKKLVLNSFHVIWSKFYKKSFLEENNIRFMNHKIFNDVQFHIKTMIYAKRVSYLPKMLYNYRKEEQKSLQNINAKTDEGFIIFKIFDEIKDFLIEEDIYSLLKEEFIYYIVNQSKVRFDRTISQYKEEVFQLVKNYFGKLGEFDIKILKKEELQKFYIHIIMSTSYSEYLFYLTILENNQVKNTAFSDKIIQENAFLTKSSVISFKKNDNINQINLLNQINQKDKEISDLVFYKNLLFEISDNFDNLIDPHLINTIKNNKLFDENYYVKKYNIDIEFNPLLHYLFMGYKEGKNPCKKFDGKYYMDYYDIPQDSINPLVHFVKYGIDQGLININKNMDKNDLRWINKEDYVEKIKNFDELGVYEHKRNPALIVSLTSFPERIYDIHFCIYSLLNQDLKPDKVILWLATDEFPNKEKDLPIELLNLKENGLTIKWTENLLSYKKLIPALKEYPNDIIVIVDDDIFYPENWLRQLYECYLENPQNVIGHRAREISLKDEKIIPYKDWEIILGERDPSFKLFMTGAGGVLYPPNCLYSDVLNEELFKNLCPAGDDIWFWAMALLNNTKIKVVENNYSNLIYVNAARQFGILNEKTLWSFNQTQGNDYKINRIIEYYPQLIKLLKE